MLLLVAPSYIKSSRTFSAEILKFNVFNIVVCLISPSERSSFAGEMVLGVKLDNHMSKLH